MMRHIAYLAVFLVVLGCNRDTGPLRIYVSLDPAEMPPIVEGYKKDAGVTIEFVRLSAGETLARLKTEANRPHASVWAGGPSFEHHSAALEGFLEPYQPKLEFELSPPYRDKAWRWIGLYASTVGFISNSDFHVKKKIAPPTSWNDLLKPEYKNQVSLAFPYTSGTAYAILLSILGIFGEEKGWEYVRKLNDNVHHYTKSGGGCITQVGLGEVGAGLAFSHEIFQKGIEQKFPVKHTYPTEGTGFEVAGISLVKGGPDLDRGKAFINWMMGSSGQTILARWDHSTFHPSVPRSPNAADLSKMKIAVIDVDDAARRRSERIAKWRDVTGR